jgi:flagellar FliL protein
VIRNNLLMLMNGRDYKSLMNREGKEALRLECLKEVQRILTKETGSAGIEDLYFTSFVVQ